MAMIAQRAQATPVRRSHHAKHPGAPRPAPAPRHANTPNSTCERCGAAYYAPMSQWSHRRYCSYACRYNHPNDSSQPAPSAGLNATSAFQGFDAGWGSGYVDSMPAALALVEAGLATASGSEASLLEIERNALRWCQAEAQRLRRERDQRRSQWESKPSEVRR